MTKRKSSNVPSDGESDNRPKQSRRRPRAPWVKPLPDSKRDPRDDPDAARTAMLQVLAGGGRAIRENEIGSWPLNLNLEALDAETLEPSEGVKLDAEGRLRFREKNEKHGPGRLKLRTEEAVEQAEADFARTVNELDQMSNLLGNQATAVRRAASVRSGKGADVGAKVCQLYEASSLPVRNRASAITRSMARKGYPISVQQVRKILRTHRSGNPPN